MHAVGSRWIEVIQRNWRNWSSWSKTFLERSPNILHPLAWPRMTRMKLHACCAQTVAQRKRVEIDAWVLRQIFSAEERLCLSLFVESMSFSGGTHSFQEVEPRCVFGKRQVLLPTPRLKSRTRMELSLQWSRNSRDWRRWKQAASCRRRRLCSSARRWVTNSKPEADEGFELGQRCQTLRRVQRSDASHAWYGSLVYGLAKCVTMWQLGDTYTPQPLVLAERNWTPSFFPDHPKPNQTNTYTLNVDTLTQCINVQHGFVQDHAPALFIATCLMTKTLESPWQDPPAKIIC